MFNYWLDLVEYYRNLDGTFKIVFSGGAELNNYGVITKILPFQLTKIQEVF